MNAYRISIWRSVKHNGKFVTNIHREIIIHARNSKEADAKITLAPEHTYDSSPTLKIEVSSETIYSTTKIGTVTIEPYYVYSDGQNPISVEQYKTTLKKALQEVKR